MNRARICIACHNLFYVSDIIDCQKIMKKSYNIHSTSNTEFWHCIQFVKTVESKLNVVHSDNEIAKLQSVIYWNKDIWQSVNLINEVLMVTRNIKQNRTT